MGKGAQSRELIMEIPTLQKKLKELLRGTPAITVLPEIHRPWTELELREVAAVVSDFVNQCPDCDEGLTEWLDSAAFVLATFRRRTE